MRFSAHKSISESKLVWSQTQLGPWTWVSPGLTGDTGVIPVPVYQVLAFGVAPTINFYAVQGLIIGHSLGF